MAYVLGFLLSALKLVVTPEMNGYLRRMQPRHLISIVVLFSGFYCAAAAKLTSLTREVAVDGDDVAFGHTEEFPDDVLGGVCVEVLAGEDVHGETLADGPTVDGHVGGGDDAHACDSTFVLEDIRL